MVTGECDDDRERKSADDKPMNSELLTIEDVLVSFKQEEDPTSAEVIAENKNALKLFACWKSLGVVLENFMCSEEVLRLPRVDLWFFLWTKVSVDMDLLTALSGLSRSSVKRALPILITNRLVYPDGAVSKAAEARLFGVIENKD